MGSVNWGVYPTGLSAEGKRKTHVINGWDSLDTPMVNELGWGSFHLKPELFQMATILITAEVENAEEWNHAFRTHGELFRKQTISRVDMGTTDDNHVACVFHVGDPDVFFEVLNSPATKEAMGNDGVKPATVKVFMLDGRFDP